MPINTWQRQANPFGFHLVLGFAQTRVFLLCCISLRGGKVQVFKMPFPRVIKCPPPTIPGGRHRIGTRGICLIVGMLPRIARYKGTLRPSIVSVL